MELYIQKALSRAIAAETLLPQQWQSLVDWKLAAPRRAQAWGIDAHSVTKYLQTSRLSRF